MDGPLLDPEEHVLSTLEADGSRRWLNPRLSKHRWLARRRVVAYVLIAVFTLLPFVKVGGKPFVLLDITARRFTIFGFTFLPTDTVLLAIFMVGLLLSIFLFTALFGRIWCGWACPQTVYMEFVFRPIERLFEGTVGRGGHKKNVPAWRTGAKYVVFFLISVYLANTFLAYFIGVDRLREWITGSPFEHPVPFLIMAGVTFAMMFDFCFFREQLCLIACPYGRFQSVMLDQNSLIVAYDAKRGEPRGKKKKKPDPNLPVLGDCIDCRQCVTTCPTGIDIRDGLQMECINCTQCIDACNLVMEKIGREPNLIRYSSQARDAGKRGSLIRVRTIIYPLLIAGIAAAFLGVFLSSKTFDVTILREAGLPYNMTAQGEVQNSRRIKVTNRTDEPMRFSASVDGLEGAKMEIREDDFELKPRETRTFHAIITTPPDVYTLGESQLQFQIKNQDDVSRTLRVKLSGPYR